MLKTSGPGKSGLASATNRSPARLINDHIWKPFCLDSIISPEILYAYRPHQRFDKDRIRAKGNFNTKPLSDNGVVIRRRCSDRDLLAAKSLGLGAESNGGRTCSGVG